MCSDDNDFVYLGLQGYAIVRGSVDSNAYRDSSFDAESNASTQVVKDWYFIINPNVENNLLPVFGLINSTVSESSILSFNATATDPDGDNLTYSATNLPFGATYDTITGLFEWSPDYDDAGSYEVTFTATDDGEPQLSASTTITITVLDSNRAPVLSPIGNQTINEGQLLTFNVAASDADGDNLTYSAANLPPGATFNGQTFSWTPGYGDAGNYDDLEFAVMDGGEPMELDVELITITVGNVNRAPVIVNPGPQEVLETEQLTFAVTASDPDNDTVTVTATNLPSGSSFNTSTGEFSWTPDLSDEGVYTVEFTAIDNGSPAESSVLSVAITVGDNPTPVEQAEDIVDDVIELVLPQNVENSYLANLHKVGQFILEGKITAAINQLNAFINKVEQDYQQELLTTQERDSLVTAATNLIADLSN